MWHVMKVGESFPHFDQFVYKEIKRDKEDEKREKERKKKMKKREKGK